ncbi:unnamed protein product [Brachionus calyciflorus]|uniref:BED-type domain-containing protein n=1 Tax=Brachionus calyciflorus TaxID=104777 RepID=A0A813NG34_9BILA|nr:unnamed protein product [Brachionus calyciflorus]
MAHEETDFRVIIGYVCNMEIEYLGTPANLKSHLNSNHRIFETKKNNGSKDGCVSESESEFEEEEDIREKDDIKLSQKKVDHLNKKIINFIVKTCQPLSILESDAFKELLIELNRKYEIPCR